MRDEAEIMREFQQQVQRIVDESIESGVAPGWGHGDEWEVDCPYAAGEYERYRQIYQNSMEYCRRFGYCLESAFEHGVNPRAVFLLLRAISQMPINSGEDLAERIEQLGEVHEDYLRPRRTGG